MTQTLVVDVSTTPVQITFNLGETFQLAFPVLAGGAAQSAVGFTAKAVVKAYGTGTVLATWGTHDGSIVCDSTGVTLLFDGTVTTAWTWTKGQFELDIAAGGFPGRLAEGPIVAKPQLVTPPIT